MHFRLKAPKLVSVVGALVNLAKNSQTSKLKESPLFFFHSWMYPIFMSVSSYLWVYPLYRSSCSFFYLDRVSGILLLLWARFPEVGKALGLAGRRLVCSGVCGSAQNRTTVPTDYIRSSILTIKNNADRVALAGTYNRNQPIA